LRDLYKLLLLPRHIPKHRPRYNTIRHIKQLLRQVNSRTRMARDILHKSQHLNLPNPPHRLHPPRRQQLERRNPPQLPPVVPVRRVDKVDPSIHNLSLVRVERPLREANVMGPHHLLRSLSRRNDHVGYLP
ncbi:hypothetical protein LINPERHAP1_LOCUS43196, partial [Linum perenne]